MGVTVVAVDGESAASTAWESEFNVTIGGRIGGVLTGRTAALDISVGLLLEGECPLPMEDALTGGV